MVGDRHEGARGTADGAAARRSGDDGDRPSAAEPEVEEAPSGPGRTAARAGVRDAGMATAEYAIATLAAAGFAGLLIAVLRSDEVRGLLAGIVRQALSL